jgi:hypothetical protein
MAIGTAAAIIGGSVIAGVAGSRSASKAADAQTNAANTSVAEQRRQFNVTERNLQPFQQAGTAAIGAQQDLLGLNGEEAQSTAFLNMENSPGQQFLRDRAQKNLLRNSSAIGGLGGGRVRSALVEQGVGFAQQDLQNQFGRLGQLAGQGQNAATSIGQFGQNSANNISNSMIAGGNARASGIMNRNAAFQNTLSGITTGLTQGGIIGGTPPPNNGFATNRG